MEKLLCTTVEQSRLLLKKGLDPKTCDLTWLSTENTHDGDFFLDFNTVSVDYGLFSFRNGYTLPCWTFGQLQTLMPDEVDVGAKTITGRTVRYFLNIDSPYAYHYKCDEEAYMLQDDAQEYLHTEFGENWLDAAVKMVVWLLENKLIKKNGE